MQYFIIIVSVILVSFFIWASVGNRKQKKKQDKKEEKPSFHSEEDLEEYGKSMDSHPVDFDDAEWFI